MMKRIICFLLPILIPVLLVIGVNNFLDRKLQVLLNEKDLSCYGSAYDNKVRDNGVLYKNYAINNNDLFLMGSSEIRIEVPQSARNFFPFEGAEYNVCPYGRSGVQSLQQAASLGSLNLQENSKVTYMISPQWFERKDGVKDDNFIGNFSELQFYKFLNNPKISKENKEYYATRVFDCLRKNDKFISEALYARMYVSENRIFEIVSFLTKPYYIGYQYLLEVKDKAMTYNDLNKLSDKNHTTIELRNVNWNSEYSNIEDKINNTQFNNQFNVDNDWYSKNKKTLDKNKNGKKNVVLNNSKELDDCKFYLNVCKDLGIKPYVIIIPLNGLYEDYTSLKKEIRTDFYNSIGEILKEREYDYLDLREYEYKKGFFIDVSHPGEEGWLKLSEEIYNEYSKK